MSLVNAKRTLVTCFEKAGRCLFESKPFDLSIFKRNLLNKEWFILRTLNPLTTTFSTDLLTTMLIPWITHWLIFVDCKDYVIISWSYVSAVVVVSCLTDYQSSLTRLFEVFFSKAKERKKLSLHNHNVYTTSITLGRRCMDVEITSCAYKEW